MKTAKLLLIGIFSIALLSCNSNTPVEEDKEPIENTEQEPTETVEKEEPTEEVVASGPVYGIDISKYQGDEIDLMQKSEDSLSFIICRSTEGVTYTDPKFASNWETAKVKGYIRGAYHFYRTDDAPQQQAANFLNAISDLEDADLPPVIDFEEESIVPGSNKTQVQIDLVTFLNLIEKKCGRRPIIYTDINIGNSYLTDPVFAKYPLWVANYTDKAEPTMPGAWRGKEWVLWQQSDNYRYENIQDDFDLFNGTLDDLKKFISSSILK